MDDTCLCIVLIAVWGPELATGLAWNGECLSIPYRASTSILSLSIFVMLDR